MHWGRFVGALLGGLLTSAALAADRDLTIEVTPVFMSVATPQRAKPYRVDLENRGRDTRGVVVITNEQFRMEYPVDLPQGSHKSFTAYIAGDNFYGQTRATLDTSIGSVFFPIQTEGFAQNGVLLISDHSGGISFLRARGQNMSENGTQLTDYDVKPSNTPDRTTGYLGMAAVMLGDGAERMSDDQVAAIRRFLLLGGTLIVQGGASSAVLTDPRWASILPFESVHPETVTYREAVGIMNMGVKGTFTVVKGKKKPEAIVLASLPDGTPFVVKRQAGFGRVIMIAVNMLEGPALNWAGRGGFMSSLNLAEGAQDVGFLISGGRQQDPYGGSYGATPYAYSSSSYSPYGTGSGMANDPFSAKMPETMSVVLVLGIYFVLVVPINLLVLRKLNKGEWAWLTSPLISLAFAGIFFRSAAGLYSATLSTATSGVLIGDGDMSEAYFAGHTQIFFPRGGEYDLGFKNVDSVSGSPNMYGMSSSKVMDKMSPVDTGEIRAQRMQVSNLNFQEFDFQQRFQGGKWFEVTHEGKEYRVTNRSPYHLAKCKLVVDGVAYPVGELGTLASKVTSHKTAQEEPDGIYGNAVTRRCSGQRMAVVGVLSDFKPGPKLGEMAPNYSILNLVYFLNRRTP